MDVFAKQLGSAIGMQCNVNSYLVERYVYGFLSLQQCLSPLIVGEASRTRTYTIMTL